jgi:hypothetical protein
LKFSSKGGSTPYTVLFVQVVVFSFVVSFGLAWFFKEAPVPVEKTFINRQQLFKNYRILNYFMASGPAADPLAPEAEDLENPLLNAIHNLKQAQQLASEKQYQQSAEILAGIPDRFPHIAAKRDALLLKSAYARKKYRDFVDYFDAHPSESLEIKVMRLDCLLKTEQQKKAIAEFNALFSRHPLSAFLQSLPSPVVAVLLKGLNEEYWFDKFSFLLKTDNGSEFNRELPYSGFRDLNRIFQAEFAYANRHYAQARQLLRVPLSEKYMALAEKIIIKSDVREDPRLDVEERLLHIAANSRWVPELLFDLGQILVGKREFAKALPYYERYLQLSREKDEKYWKTAWLMAWIHYRQTEKDKALTYFHLGSESPFPSYRIASQYWRNKLENSAQSKLSNYPFSYYAVKVLGNKEGFKNLHQTFLSGMDDPPGPHFLEVVADLKVLVKYKLWDEAMETIHWAKGDARLSSSDLNLLKVIESLLYYQQNSYFLAYSKFRSNFPNYENVCLPNFLSGIFFPRQYEDLVAAYSREQEVDPALVLSLIREESFFRSDVRSPANAYGLMQLLHGTARQVAKGSGLAVKANDLYDPKINIRLGLLYLKTLLDRYDGRLYLALAAYNAGPHRVDQWLQDFPDADEEEFIEMIPFTETRTYVKNILRNYFFYKYYYDIGKP